MDVLKVDECHRLQKMGLLSLPDELLYAIAQELCDLHQILDWRSSIVDTSRARLITLDFGLRSLHKVNKRLQAVVTPFYFRAVSVSTVKHLADAAKSWHGREEYARWIRTFRISATMDSNDDSYYAQLRLMFRVSVNLTSLHVLHPAPADQRFFEALSQCKSLKHLWITSISEKTVDCVVPELRDLRLESASFCAHPRGAQLAERIPRAMKPVSPIQTLLSGSSRHTLRFLHFRRATERLFVHMNKTLSSPIQRLEHVIPDNVVFESLETLKIGGVTAQDFWLGNRAVFFPALRNLMTGIDPLLAVASSHDVWPGLRCLAVHKLLARDRLVCSAPSLEEFSMFSPLTASELGILIADLGTLLPSSRLTILSIRLVVRPGLHLTPASVHDIDALFSSVPNVEKLTLMAMTDWGHFPWEMDREAYIVAFSSTSVDLWSWRDKGDLMYLYDSRTP